MPAFLLKRQILMNLPSDNLEAEVANSIDFMAERVSTTLIYINIHLQVVFVANVVRHSRTQSVSCTSNTKLF